MYIKCSVCIVLCSTEVIVSHYRRLWATMWLPGIEFQASGRTVTVLNCWAIISPTQKIIFLSVCVYMYAWVCITQKLEALDAVALESKEIVNCPMCILATGLRSSGRAVHVVNH